MQPLKLSARMPAFESCIELAALLRAIDGEALVAISEGRNCSGAWMFDSNFILENVSIRFRDLQELFATSIAEMGGTSFLARV